MGCAPFATVLVTRSFNFDCIIQGWLFRQTNNILTYWLSPYLRVDFALHELRDQRPTLGKQLVRKRCVGKQHSRCMGHPNSRPLTDMTYAAYANNQHTFKDGSYSSPWCSNPGFRILQMNRNYILTSRKSNMTTANAPFVDHFPLELSI